MGIGILSEPAMPAAPPGPDEPLHEVVHGRRLGLPSIGAYATWLASRLGYQLGPFVTAHQLGVLVIEMLFILDAVRDIRRRPDLAFVSVKRWPLGIPPPEVGDWEVIPDLAVEVASPNDLFKDVTAKVEEYFLYGVRQVWVILPERRQVYVYDAPAQVRILTTSMDLDGGELLPDFRLSLPTLFTQPGSPAREQA